MKKILILFVVVLFGLQTHAQEIKFTKPSWWFGVAGAANFNFYNGSTQHINSTLMLPRAVHEGMGIGLYLSPTIEYHDPISNWGFMFQAGYDNRKGAFKTVIGPCNCPEDLTAKISYLTFEPSIRYDILGSNFYAFGGGVLGISLNKKFEYQIGTNPDIPDQVKSDLITGDFDNMNSLLMSANIGMGYDIPLNSTENKTQYVVSPFLTYLPYLGQKPRSIETWNINTVRIGAILKFGRGAEVKENDLTENTMTPSDIQFSIYSAKNVPSERRMRETFPLRNYIFFDTNSANIPDRYITIKKSEIADFKEDQLEVTSPKKLSGRSDREMIVYYNILNILGDRMQKNPNSSIVLIGSSENGHTEGKLMAENVKTYLTETWSISESRIKTEGNDKPKIPSEKIGGTKDLVLLSEGNRRVSIESNNPEMLMEFQSGPTAPLKPVELLTTQSNPPESYVTFTVPNAEELLKSWSLEITDENYNMKKYGSYTSDKISILGKTILGDKKEGKYKVKMIAITKDGKYIIRENTVKIVLWTPAQNEMGIRYSVLFEYDESKANAIYEKYLTEIVGPKIPKNALVIIQGFTDVVGDAANNKKLSNARASEVKSILSAYLTKVNRTDVRFEVYGFGEDEDKSPFANEFPEERFYNRTVLIDIIPKK